MTRTVLDLERYAPALINFISNKLSRGASEIYRRRFGIGIVDWRVMSLLAVEEGITSNRVCDVIGLDKAAVSRALKHLEAQGLVTVARHPGDARRYTLQLTNEGYALHDEIIVVALERERQLLSDFSAQEVDTLLILLHRMHTNIVAIDAHSGRDGEE